MAYGNPGLRYDNTRHNVGFLAIDKISEKMDIKVDKNKFNAIIGEGYYKGEKILLVKPQTYMNLSGESVKPIMDFYKVNIEDLIVIYDDIDVEIGNIRIKPSGSSGTHNGMRNICEMLGVSSFPRIRMGTGKVFSGIDLKDFVLMKMSKEEMEIIDKVVENVYNSLIEILEHGIEKAMSIYNRKNEV